MVFGGVAIGEIGYATEPAGVTIYVTGDDNHIHKYSNGSWEVLTVPSSLTLGFDNIKFQCIATCPNNPLRVMAYDNTPGFVFSSDGGGTWSQITMDELTNPDSIYEIRHLYIHTDGDLYALLGDGGELADHGIWRSQDDGLSWDHVMASPSGLQIGGMLGIPVTQDGGDERMWLWSIHRVSVNNNHIMHSALINPASSWTLDHGDADAWLDIQPAPDSAYYNYPSIIWPSRYNRVWVAWYGAAGQPAQLKQFDVNGDFAHYPVDESVEIFGSANHNGLIDFMDGTVVIWSSFDPGGYVWRSVDDGETWTPIITGADDRLFASTGPLNGPQLVKDPGSDDLYICGADLSGAWGVLKSSDRGSTWETFYTDTVDTNSGYGMAIGRA